MRPARSLTELLFGPALTVTAWSDQPNPGPAAPPTRRSQGLPGRAPGGLNWFLGLGLGGLAALLTGLIWDAGLHARSAVGVAELPMNAPVEVELVVSPVPEVD